MTPDLIGGNPGTHAISAAPGFAAPLNPGYFSSGIKVSAPLPAK
jgi:hypothetical protein